MREQQYNLKNFSDLCDQVKLNIAANYSANNITDTDVERVVILNIFFEMFDFIGIKISEDNKAKHRDALTNPSIELTEERSAEIVDFIRTHWAEDYFPESEVEELIKGAIAYVIDDRQKRTTIN